MLVKAKWNVKDAAGWHYTGEVFHTEDDLGAAVEVLDAPKPVAVKAEPENAPEDDLGAAVEVLDAPKPVAVKAEPENAPEGAQEAKQKASRRKKSAE